LDTPELVGANACKGIIRYFRTFQYVLFIALNRLYAIKHLSDQSCRKAWILGLCLKN